MQATADNEIDQIIQPFYELKKTPIPEGLKVLPIRDEKGPSWRFTHQDWDFADHPRLYVGQALAGDEKAQLLCERAMHMFLDLMKRDVRLQDKLNPLSGLPARDSDGNKIQELRSVWLEAQGFQGGILPGNVRLPEDFWFRYVKHNWMKILPELRWFDPEPSTDPEDPHNEKLIQRKMDPRNPARANAIAFLKKYEIGVLDDADGGKGKGK